MIGAMLYIDASRHRILAFAAHRKWGAAQYAKAAGLPKTTVHDVLNGGNATEATLRAMELVIPKSFRAPRQPPAQSEPPRDCAA